jgi:hypothetical protein
LAGIVIGRPDLKWSINQRGWTVADPSGRWRLPDVFLDEGNWSIFFSLLYISRDVNKDAGIIKHPGIRKMISTHETINEESHVSKKAIYIYVDVYTAR